MNAILIRVTLYILAAYVGLCLYMYVRQDRLLFLPPQTKHDIKPNHIGVVPYELIQGDIHLRGWLIHPEFADRKLLIYYGGNGEDIFYEINHFSKLQGVATLLVAYRGYGNSDGSPSETHFFADALAIYDESNTRLRPKETIVLGRSLGSGVACYVAGKRDVDKVILVTPFDSMTKVVQGYYPWLPARLLLRHPFNSLKHVHTSRASFLIIYGGQDHIVAGKHTKNLIDHLPKHTSTKILQIPEADHNDIQAYPDYWPAIQAYLGQDAKMQSLSAEH